MDESSAPPPPDYQSAGEILQPALRLWLLIMLIHGAARLVTIVLTANLSANGAENAVAYVLPTDIAQLVALAVTIKAVWRDPDARRVFRTPPKKAIEICILIGIVSSLFFKMWYEWLANTTGIAAASNPLDGWVFAVVLVQYTLLAPLMEEWAFRGLMLQRFRQVMGGTMAVATQAMMFSVMHMDSGELVSHFLFGVFAGVMRIQARALWPCMLLHALWNGAWVLLLNG